MDFTGCGVTKGCFLPENCAPKDCQMAMSYAVSGELLEIELMGSATVPGSYVAVGFSMDGNMVGRKRFELIHP
jgi:hypothetical protein